MITNFIFTLQCFVYAAALAISKRDVFNPTITYPTASTVWNVGEVHNITWSIANAPTGFPINNATGTILLGFLANDSENLDVDHPLADKFLLKDQKVDITVPDVESRNDYIIVLLGDSGNASPQFTIHNVTIGKPPPGSSSSRTTTIFSTSTSGGGGGSDPTQTPTSTPQGGSPITSQSNATPPATTTSPANGSTQSGAPVTTLVVSDSSSSGTAAPTIGAASTGSASGLLQSTGVVNFLSSVGLLLYFLL